MLGLIAQAVIALLACLGLALALLGRGGVSRVLVACLASPCLASLIKRKRERACESLRGGLAGALCRVIQACLLDLF